MRAGDIAFAAETRLPAQPAVEVLHEPIGAELAPAFAAAGWQVSRHLLMALEGHAPEAARTPSRRSTPRWSGRCARSGCAPSRGAPRTAVAAMLEWERAPGGADGRAGVLRARGRAARSRCACCSSTPHADEVERVYTTPAHRGRGLAYSVVARAAQEAGEQLTFLFTDAHGAAQHLYARLGFRRAWVVYRFARVGCCDARARAAYAGSSRRPPA